VFAYIVLYSGFHVMQTKAIAANTEGVKPVNSSKTLQCVVSLTLITLFLAACGAPSSAPVSVPPTSVPTVILPAAAPTAVPSVAAPAPPTPGKWAGTAEFGTFVLTVNPKGTGVTYIAYTFSGYKCGPKVLSGGVANGLETGWDGKPINNGQFTFDGQTMTVQGTFDPSGTSASGTWTMPGCSGTWTASPSK